MRALKLLEQKGKATIFKGTSADDEGVKFSAWFIILAFLLTDKMYQQCCRRVYPIYQFYRDPPFFFLKLRILRVEIELCYLNMIWTIEFFSLLLDSEVSGEAPII